MNALGLYTTADQLTVDLARRAHQSPGRLVDEDGRSERAPSRTADRSESCPSSPSLVSSSLFLVTAVRADVERRMWAADRGVRSKLFKAACRTFLTLSRHFAREFQWYVYYRS